MADQFASVVYRRNFLNEVIARVDFVSPLSKLAHELPQPISKLALREFPIFEPRELRADTVLLKGKDVSRKTDRFQEWRFHGKEREKTFVIGPEATFVTYKRYSTFEVLQREFLGLLAQVFEQVPDAQPSRLGLRYINAIELGGANPLDWSGVIEEPLLGLFSFFPERKNALSRVFHILDYAFDECHLQYQFGIHNPDHPARIRQKVFVLDFDAFQQGVIERESIPTMLNQFHAHIQETFEKSIGPRLREALNAE
jgi:uncharacterized protein (TIGR04255 family)